MKSVSGQPTILVYLEPHVLRIFISNIVHAFNLDVKTISDFNRKSGISPLGIVTGKDHE